MRKFILISLIGIFIPVLLFGQAKVATAGAQFLEIGVGARAEGMAQTFLATADDATALYYNPAGVALLVQREIVFNHIEYPADINIEYMGFVYPNLLGGNLGVQFTALTALDMIETTPYHTSGTGRTFSASDFSGTFTYSRRLTEKFSIGLSAKYIGEFFADKKAHGWGVDIGTLFLTGFKTIRIGMKMANFGPDMSFYEKGGSSYPLPMTFHFGLAGDPLNDGLHKLTLSFEGSHPPDNREKFQLGMEYWFASKYALRAGKFIQPTYEETIEDKDADTSDDVKYTDNSRNFAVGAGAKLPLGGLVLKVDYAYTVHRDFNVHRISGGFQF